LLSLLSFNLSKDQIRQKLFEVIRKTDFRCSMNYFDGKNVHIPYPNSILSRKVEVGRVGSVHPGFLLHRWAKYILKGFLGDFTKTPKNILHKGAKQIYNSSPEVMKFQLPKYFFAEKYHAFLNFFADNNFGFYRNFKTTDKLKEIFGESNYLNYDMGSYLLLYPNKFISNSTFESRHLFEFV
jgi:hypothetical protein